MELVPGRFEHEPQWRFGGEVEAELVRRARGGAGDGAGKAAVDRAVQMAAQDTLDLRMAGYDRAASASLFCRPARCMRRCRSGRVDGASSARPVAPPPRRARGRARRAAPSIIGRRPRLACARAHAGYRGRSRRCFRLVSFASRRQRSCPARYVRFVTAGWPNFLDITLPSPAAREGGYPCARLRRAAKLVPQRFCDRRRGRCA
jgi:hypothetical protein